jgi:hypothetical protein
VVEAAGQLVPPLSRRAGLCLHPVARMRSVLSGRASPDPSACPPAMPVGRSMSLYRAGLRLALFLPLGVAIPSCDGCRVRRCEPRYHSALTGRGNHTDRTRVRKSYTARTTCLSRSFGSRLAPAGRQADAQPVTSTDPHGQVTKPRRGADVNDAAPPDKPGLRPACPSA